VEGVFCAAAVPGVGVCEEHLFVWGVDCVCDWLSGGGVDAVLVYDFVDAVWC